MSPADQVRSAPRQRPNCTCLPCLASWLRLNKRAECVRDRLLAEGW